MKKMINKQYGIGFLGICSILVLIGFFTLTGLKLFPLYNEKFVVINAMEGIVEDPASVHLSKKEIRKLFIRKINVSLNVSTFNDITVKDFVTIEKDKETRTKYLHVKYESRTQFIKDINLLLTFDRRLELGKMVDE